MTQVRSWFWKDHSHVCSRYLACEDDAHLISRYRSTIIEYLRSTYTESKNGLVYFFCKDRSPKLQILKTFMMVFITQLTKLIPDCRREIEAARNRKDRILTESDYLGLVKAILKYFRRVVIVVDALDESVEQKEFSNAFEELLSHALSNTTVLILVTSREEVNVERLVVPLATSKLSLEHRMRADIETYVTAEVDRRIRSCTLKLRDAGLRTKIIRSLVDRADGL